MRIFFAMCLLLSIAVRAQAEQKGAASDDDLSIVVTPRKAQEHAPLKASKEFDDFFAKKLFDTEFLKDAAEVAGLLVNPALTDDGKTKLNLAILRDSDRAKKAFATLLDWHRTPDAKIRLGALTGIQIAYSGRSDVGSYIGASALAEPDAKVRKASIEMIKDNNERGAVKYIFAVLLKVSEVGEFSAVANDGAAAQAIAALREIGDKQVYEVLLYLEKVKMNAGITGSAFLDNPKIMAPNTDLPCMTPNHEVGMMEAVQTFPGLEVLKAVSGENFQHDLKKGQEWIDKQPTYKGREK